MSSKRALVAASLAVCSASASWLAGSGKHPVYAREAVPGLDQGDEKEAVHGVTGYLLNPIFLASDGQLAARAETTPLTWQVKKGDTLTKISGLFGVSVGELAAYNRLPDPDLLRVNQELKIPLCRKWVPLKGGDTAESLAKEHKTTPWLILWLNPALKNPETMHPGQLVAVPYRLEEQKTAVYRSVAKQKKTRKKSSVRLADLPDLNLGPVSFSWPVRGSITSKFGWRSGRQHKGIDIWSSARSNALIRAAAPGVVKEAGYSGNYGNIVVIDHGGGWTTAYAHLSRIGVSKGETVERGRVIGNMGRSGNATGYHLHFEVRKDGRPINPLSVLGK
ncbi:M23 family metallopeptidase [Staphylospora marina]|uniref:M23 family metallopeptidase n=1 Tax=Staphylospora marina TaxID=2490858 RepID=UPI000F5BA2F9|nr:M23 family metallopeptidase [Staphylospora marina]